MKRLCVLGVVFTILCSGGVSSELIRNAVVDEGDPYTVSVTTMLHNVITCHLKPPLDDIISFSPGDENQSTDKYHIEQGEAGVAECMLTIKNVDEYDEGIWVISYDQTSGVGRNQTYDITVNHAEPIEYEEIEEDGVTLLTDINHFTRQEMSIDISLNKESFEEECYVRPPNGELIRADLFRMENVTVRSSSNYVSCRITVGPMSEHLLGSWRLCGKSMETDEMRCQPANITWNNNNAIAIWESLTQSRFSHPVHFGGSVNPGVLGRGDVLTCHVITPNGEDLVIKSDVKYPHIERIALDRPSLCSINFTNIDRSSIGDWSIYGKFRAVLVGLNEVHLPLNFFLYDENDPYQQAYNVTVLPEERRLVNLGTDLEVEVTNGGGEVDDCQLRMPSGQSFDLHSAVNMDGIVFKSLHTDTACRLSINHITEKMLGEWQIIGKFSNGNQFSERQQTLHIIQEDPANPIVGEHRVVENKTETVVDTEMGASHTLTINYAVFDAHESCHLLTPNGLQYAFIPGFDMDHVEVLEQNYGIQCGVVVHVLTEDMIGEWTLIARAIRFSEPIERRLSFTIHVEETSSLGNAINITEGADLYLALPETTDLYETCKLYGPDGVEVTNYDVDPMNIYSCGYIVRGVKSYYNGTWQIVYGNRITYRASVEVNILESQEIFVEDQVWTLGMSVYRTVGPKDAVYCRVTDNIGNKVFEGFGTCKIMVHRVTKDHIGTWMIYVGVRGSVLPHKHTFNVDIEKADSKPLVTTSVVRNAPSVLLTCSVPVQYVVMGCKFRDPRGNILVASHGVGQDGFGTSISYESEAESHNCTLRLMNPTVEDLGLWRCAVDTTEDTSYGFITVVCPWLMQNDDVAASVITEPLLRVERHFIDMVEGVPMVMSCSIDAAIRYCYFRAKNGTIFNVGPSILSPHYEYEGSGFDAGECGIRFSSLSASDDGGSWSCHVGLTNTSTDEQRAFSNVLVQEKLSVSHSWEGTSMSVRSWVYNDQPLDYCRFVRIDGLGFTSYNLPPGYSIAPILDIGRCNLQIEVPSILDQHPWTVAVKISGMDGEITKSTMDTLLIHPPQEPEPESQVPEAGGMPRFAVFLALFVTILGFLLISAAVALIPKKNREWTYDRASRIRNSFRKQPLHNDILTDLPRKV